MKRRQFGVRNSEFGVRNTTTSRWNRRMGWERSSKWRIGAEHSELRIPNSEFPGSYVSTRFGSTLTEVLVALLVMSIGLVSLTTMFPLSVLRSIKAAQLT